MSHLDPYTPQFGVSLSWNHGMVCNVVVGDVERIKNFDFGKLDIWIELKSISVVVVANSNYVKILNR